MNKYLEKIASGDYFYPGLSGALSSDSGDTIGGAVSGVLAGAATEKAVPKLVGNKHPALNFLAGVGAGSLAGAGYSKLKHFVKKRPNDSTE